MSMSTETANHLVKFVINNATGEKIKIKWYGGEPLVNSRVIDIISSGLSAGNVIYESTMISNAYLFNPELILRAKKHWHLINVRITLDGAEQTYNKVKAYTNVSGSPFIKVFDNIDCLLLNGIGVTFRFNIEVYNMSEIRQLADTLIARYKGNDLVSFSINPLNNTDANHDISSEGLDRQNVIDFIFDLKNQISSYGFTVNYHPLPKMTKHLCKADDKRHLLIKPNGEIAFCAEDFNCKSFGTIFNDFSGVNVPSRMNDVRHKFDLCFSCPLFPSCTLSKDCPSILHKCNSKSLENNIREVKQSMIIAYNNYLKSHENQTGIR